MFVFILEYIYVSMFLGPSFGHNFIILSYAKCMENMLAKQPNILLLTCFYVVGIRRNVLCPRVWELLKYGHMKWLTCLLRFNDSVCTWVHC